MKPETIKFNSNSMTFLALRMLQAIWATHSPGRSFRDATWRERAGCKREICDEEKRNLH